MDTIVLCLLFIEAFFALWLLKNEYVMDSVSRVMATYGLLITVFVLRALCLDYETLDYQNFLSHWVEYYRVNGGVKAFSAPLGNYNIPYMYFLCLFSYLPVKDLYLIKVLSIGFDVVLAYAVMKLVDRVNDDPNIKLASFFTVLLLPTECSMAHCGLSVTASMRPLRCWRCGWRWMISRFSPCCALPCPSASSFRPYSFCPSWRFCSSQRSTSSGTLLSSPLSTSPL